MKKLSRHILLVLITLLVFPLSPPTLSASPASRTAQETPTQGPQPEVFKKRSKVWIGVRDMGPEGSERFARWTAWMICSLIIAGALDVLSKERKSRSARLRSAVGVNAVSTIFMVALAIVISYHYGWAVSLLVIGAIFLIRVYLSDGYLSNPAWLLGSVFALLWAVIFPGLHGEDELIGGFFWFLALFATSWVAAFLVQEAALRIWKELRKPET